MPLKYPITTTAITAAQPAFNDRPPAHAMKRNTGGITGSHAYNPGSSDEVLKSMMGVATAYPRAPRIPTAFPPSDPRAIAAAMSMKSATSAAETVSDHCVADAGTFPTVACATEIDPVITSPSRKVTSAATRRPSAGSAAVPATGADGIAAAGARAGGGAVADAAGAAAVGATACRCATSETPQLSQKLVPTSIAPQLLQAGVMVSVVEMVMPSRS